MSEMVAEVVAPEAKEVEFTVLTHTSHVAVEDVAAMEAVPEDWLSIAATAEATGYQPQYVRQLVLKDKVAGVKVQLDHLIKWFIDVSSVTSRVRKGRSGMRRFNLKFMPEHEDAVREALNALDIEYTMALAYVPKKKDAGAPTDEADATPIAVESSAPDFGFGDE